MRVTDQDNCEDRSWASRFTNDILAWFVACRWLLPLSAAYCGSKISTRGCEACCNPESPLREFITAHFVSLNVLQQKKEVNGKSICSCPNFGAWIHIISSSFCNVGTSSRNCGATIVLYVSTDRSDYQPNWTPRGGVYLFALYDNKLQPTSLFHSLI